MSFSFVFLLILIALIIMFCLLVLSLNNSIVHIDLLFYEIDISLGFALLISFLVGCLITVFLEIIYFLNKKRNKI